MKAIFDGRWVRLGGEGRTLYEQGGYGRPEGGGLRLAPQEALYLMERGKVEVQEYSFDALLGYFAGQQNFIRSYLVYRDIRERGYVVQPGPHDFRVFRRGHKPGGGRSQYLIRVLSERDLIEFERLSEDVLSSTNMRKQYVLAVVDDEDELTYYEVKVQNLPEIAPPAHGEPVNAAVYGTYALAHLSPGSTLEENWYGKRLDAERLMLRPVETIYLVRRDGLSLRSDGAVIDADTFVEIVGEKDVEIREKERVYADLRDKGYIPRTGYKFGHHFRVYSGKKTHSEMLVHAMPSGVSLPMSTISRSVRLAHSVKKKMLFGCVQSIDIRYVEFTRIKL
ncbi:endonuclease [Methanoculleus taiwanensis]|uniref:Endonuclease n=1 Tax=Methanoculleus taiwanensis TaxID=1550565 RepID=A0A498GZ46_9EURY|nr:tRNA-intron lyase [Methanoculleus taiwanensis]RXE55812.1 endonuclease [Methanoculleus taiwanensis]